MADVQTLLSLWETRDQAGTANTKRCREILAACMFTLCLENNENKRFLIGFQKRDDKLSRHRAAHSFPHLKRGPVTDLFEDQLGENDDIDVILVPDFGPEDLSDREIHQCQLVGYLGRPNPGPYDLVTFVEEKKLRYAPVDSDLRLIINIEQTTEFNPGLLSAYLRGRKPSCPYSQVFLVGEAGPGLPRAHEDRYWMCWMLYPELRRFQDMNFITMQRVLANRNTRCEFIPGPPPHKLGQEWFKREHTP